MKFRRTIILFISFIFIGIRSSIAQSIEMADSLRQEGKIYVVVAVVLLVLLSLVGYLWRLDKKLTKIESKNSEQ